ncbi:MAG: Gfo/Idh/MocA family oxidoreductase, partial [Saprospiraceae bacterium]|nr:Gfo/Idh/MocA family oxidoreductase [Saprospiraceae bacterium]
MNRKKVRWGILGPGKIANKFAKDLAMVADADLVSVASRSLDRAQAFAGQHLVKSAFSSYETMIKEQELDIIYIATPHTFHLEQTLLCLENGVAVLCEKPAGLNKSEVQ